MDKRLVTASRDKTARVWDTSGKLITELKGHQGDVTSASFSPTDNALSLYQGTKLPCVGHIRQADY
jgi:WD40 repeat protein